MYGAYGQAPAQQQYGYHHQQQQQQQPPQYAANNPQQQQYHHHQQQQQQQQAASVAVAEPDNNTGAGQQQQQQPAPTIYVDTQHDDVVHDARLDYYGTKLATGSSDRTIKVYDVSGDSYSPNATLAGHTGPVYQLSWSHPKYGPVLASASFDSSVLIHREVRPGEWTLIKAFVGLHESSVNSVEFAPHEYGLMACAASSDGRVSVLSHDGSDDSWTVEYLADTPLGVNAASWAPYGTEMTTDFVVGGGGGGGGRGADDDHVADADASSPPSATTTTTTTTRPSPPRIVTGGSDNGLRVWRKDERTGNWEREEFVSTVPGFGHADWVRDVAWAPNVVPGTSVVASCSEDKTVVVWKQRRGGGVADDDDDDDDDGATGGGGKGGWTPTLVNTFEDPVWRVSWVRDFERSSVCRPFSFSFAPDIVPLPPSVPFYYFFSFFVVIVRRNFSQSITGNILAVSSGDSNVTLWKEALDGSWSQVSRVEDVATSGKGAD
ncbi:hypothetical protein ACHAW5_003466 [Stephanodiscus triporus]|uniref:Uncharacterized protein n=1 Tax=Stephanodiscus triporus TaxID=2934178 RepID=A0ABD3MJQ7_9STRA